MITQGRMHQRGVVLRLTSGEARALRRLVSAFEAGDDDEWSVGEARAANSAGDKLREALADFEGDENKTEGETQ